MGPYFKGQQASPCGHYYPDVVRIKDWTRGRISRRLLNCICCGGYLVPIEGYAVSPDKMNRDGLEAVRARERERLELIDATGSDVR